MNIEQLLADAKKLHDDIAAARAAVEKQNTLPAAPAGQAGAPATQGAPKPPRINPAWLIVARGAVQTAVDNLTNHLAAHLPTAPAGQAGAPPAAPATPFTENN